MKLKFFVLTAFSLAGAALTAAPASAGWLLRHFCGGHRCETVIVCRPYNAFTPVCSGSMVCDGCCPFPFPGMHNGGCHGPGCGGNPLLGLGHDPVGLQAMQQPMLMPHPAVAMPPQQFQVPMPAPQQTQMPMTYPIHPAAYQQGYYPMYYPAYQHPAHQQQMVNPYQQAPAYWYGY